MDRERLALCPKCSHPVNVHQPSSGMRMRDSVYPGCQVCGCILTMLQKLRAWRGTVTDNERQRG